MPANMENSSVAIGLENVRFHSNPKERAMSKNAKTITQLHSFHKLVMMLKILQVRLQQYVNCELPDVQLVLEKAEEPEIKLPTSAGSKRIPEKPLFLLY